MAVIASKQEYADLIKNLLPPGPAFPRDDTTSSYAVVIDEIAGICSAIDTVACQLVIESDPRTTSQSFQEWLDDWGLPDECVVAYSDHDPTEDELRKQLVFKSARIGGQSAAFFIELAALIGRNITVTDERVEGQTSTYHKFLVNCDKETDETEATVGMFVTDPLTSFGDNLIECLIRRHKPAHTDVDFAYSLNLFNLLADDDSNITTDDDDNLLARVLN